MTEVFWGDKLISKTTGPYDKIKIFLSQEELLNAIQGALLLGFEIERVSMSSSRDALAFVVSNEEYSIALSHYRAFLDAPTPSKIGEIINVLGFLGASAEDSAGIWLENKVGEVFKFTSVADCPKVSLFYPSTSFVGVFTRKSTLERVIKKRGLWDDIEDKTFERVKRIYEWDINSFGPYVLTKVYPELERSILKFYSLRKKVDDYFFKHFLHGLVDRATKRGIPKLLPPREEDEIAFEMQEGYFLKEWPTQVVFYRLKPVGESTEGPPIVEDELVRVRIKYQCSTLLKDYLEEKRRILEEYSRKMKTVSYVHDTIVSRTMPPKKLIGRHIGQLKFVSKWEVAYLVNTPCDDGVRVHHRVGFARGRTFQGFTAVHPVSF